LGRNSSRRLTGDARPRSCADRARDVGQGIEPLHRLERDRIDHARTLAAASLPGYAPDVGQLEEFAPGMATWLENSVPEGLAVFTLPEHHRRRLRTSDPIERAVQQELKRRTVKVRVFPNDQSLLRLVSAVLVEIDETWASDNTGYIKWECRDA